MTVDPELIVHMIQQRAVAEGREFLEHDPSIADTLPADMFDLFVKVYAAGFTCAWSKARELDDLGRTMVGEASG